VVDGVTAAVVESYDFDPWGLLMPARTFAAGTKEGFTGKEQDAETGLDYFGARYYMPALGRWSAVDPLAETQPAWSPYAYVVDNPVTLVDPTGLTCVETASALQCTDITVADLNTVAKFLGQGGEQSRSGEDGQNVGQQPTGGAQQPPRRHRAVLTDEQIGNIVFNETRSLSGPGIDDVQRRIAHIVINADERWGARREQHARTASKELPTTLSKAEKSNLETIGSLVSAVRSDRAEGLDPTNGTVFFGFRDVNNYKRTGFKGVMTARRQRGTQVPVGGILGPFNNSFPTKELGPNGIYFVPFKEER
jgi:RHS repeat-associated protein